MNFDHIGVRVKSLAEIKALSSLFQGAAVTSWSIPGLQADCYDFSGVEIEFLEETVATAKPGLDHLAFTTADFLSVREKLAEMGSELEPIFTTPRGQRIFFATWQNIRLEVMENQKESGE